MTNIYSIEDSQGFLPPFMDDSWKPFLSRDVKHMLKNIESQIGTDYTPTRSFVLRFMQLDLHNIKVVILGQDPYKPEGIATGRAFQPSNLVLWQQKFRQVSLKNMIRLIHKNYFGIEEYSEIAPYTQVIQDIASGEFPIKQPAEWFNGTEKQGVMWLNTSLTCKIGESNSHKAIWADFTKLLISYISEYNPNITWFLWGKEAQEQIANIHKSKAIYRSNHPMMCSDKYSEDFLKSRCFIDTWGSINWLG